MDAVHVVGAGGIGCAVGYALRSAGVPVRFVEANPRKVEAGRHEGVEVVGHAPRSAAFVPFADWRPTAGAVVVLATKCYDNPAVLERLPRRAVLVPIQNGFDLRLAGHGHDLEGIASFVSECERDRPRARITRAGSLHLGWRTAAAPGPRIRPAALEALGGSGLFRVVEVPEIEPYKYAKLMYNAAVSPLAAAAGIDNGQLLSVPATRRLFFALLRENHRILTAAGVPLGRIGPIPPRIVARILRHRWLADSLARAFEPSLRGTFCSMAGEIAMGRTELDHYNGHLIHLARRSGTPCPLNEAVYERIARMTAERARPHPQVWAGLDAA